MPNANPASARLAAALRAAMKDQALSVADLAAAIGRTTGTTPPEYTVRRWLSDSEYPHLISIHPALATVARALDLDPVRLAADAILIELEQEAEAS